MIRKVKKASLTALLVGSLGILPPSGLAGDSQKNLPEVYKGDDPPGKPAEENPQYQTKVNENIYYIRGEGENKWIKMNFNKETTEDLRKRFGGDGEYKESGEK